MSELAFLSACALAEQVRQKKISPVELAELHLARIQELNPRLNAFVQLDGEGVRLEARVTEAALMRGEASGRLVGIPLSIKSSIEVSGLKHEVGSRLRAGCVAAADAPLVARLRSEGAVILGVTNAPEMLMAWETDNLLYGRTNNPWDLARTPGGSSGGEAAAIAAGCSVGGVGSDGGGSIRVPAHFTGICGLKPTPGRIPSTGHFPESAGPFALLGVVGPMARTVADLQLLFGVIAGMDDGDPCAAPVPMREMEAEALTRVRIGFFEEDGRTPVTKEIRACVRRAAEVLAQAGFVVENFCPSGLEQARDLWWKFFGVGAGMLLKPMTQGRECDLSPLLKEFLQWSEREPAHTGETLLETWIQRDQLRSQFLAQMRRFPILLCPVAAVPAFRHGERSWHVNGEVVNYLDAWSYCAWFNLLGNPAAVVPVGKSASGLPIGVQVVGRPWEEELVLAVAAVIERECGGYEAPGMAWRDGVT